MRAFLVVATAVAVLAAGLPAQDALAAKKVEVPVEYLGTYHLASGSWSGGLRAGASVLYNCTTPGNYYSNVGNSFATNAGHLWIDEGVLDDSNDLAVTQVNGFDFAYCSTDLEPTGNGGAVLVAFYDEHGACATGETATCAYLLSGLPLSTTGNTQCWAVGVDLAGGFECTTDTAAMFRTTDGLTPVNRSFGWAFGANPGVAGRNNTGPILDRPCALPLQGCASGGSLQGNQNFFAWEDPAGVWTGCYWFGGVPWASFTMKMYTGSTGTDAFAYGHSGNANVLAASHFAAGTPVTFSSTTSAGGPGVYLLASASTTVLNLAQGTLVVSPSFLVPPLSMPGGTATVPVPAAVPLPAFVQAAETSGPATPGALLALSNGLMLAAAPTKTDTPFNLNNQTATIIPNTAAAIRVRINNNGPDNVIVTVTTGTTTENFRVRAGSSSVAPVPANSRVDLRDENGNGARGSWRQC